MPAVPGPVGAAPSARFKIPSIGEVRKALVATSAFLGEALTLRLVHGTAQHWTTAAIGFIGAVLTFAVPNTPSA